MKKALIFGAVLAGVAAAAVAITKVVKKKEYYGDEFEDEDFDRYCCDCEDCCGDEVCEIPADKAEDAGVVVTDACACDCDCDCDCVEEEDLVNVADMPEENSEEV